MFSGMKTARGAKFADDGMAMHAIPRAGREREIEVEKVQTDLESVFGWARRWRLTLAPDKTKVICLRPARARGAEQDEELIRFRLGGVEVTQQREPVRYLGVMIDQHLRMGAHISRAAVKAKARVGLLARVSSTKWGAERRALRMLLEHWIRPVLEYGYELMFMRGQSAVSKLRTIFNSGVRVCAGAPPAAGSDGLYAELGIEQLRPRWAHLMAASAARLQRTAPVNIVSKHWGEWVKKRKGQRGEVLEWDQRPHVGVSRVGGKGGRVHVGPFGAMWACMELYKVDIYDKPREWLDPRNRSADVVSRPPWSSPEMFYTPGSVSMSLKVRTLGAASGRSQSQANEAKTLAGAMRKEMWRKARDEGRVVLSVYTDGSWKRGEWGGGAGVVWTTIDDQGGVVVLATTKCPLGMICTNYMAEQSATCKAAAIAGVVAEALGLLPEKTWVCFVTDSWGVAQALRSRGSSSSVQDYWSAAMTSRRYMKRLVGMGFRVSVEWVPGHVGEVGNEMADVLAKWSAMRSREGEGRNVVPIPVSVIKKLIKRTANDKAWWALSNSVTATVPVRVREMNGVYRQIDGLLVETRAPRVVQVAMTRMRAGYETKPEDRMRVGQWHDSECPDCEHLYADARHRLFECPRWTAEREELVMEIKEAVGRRVEVHWDRLVALSGWGGRDELLLALPIWFGFLSRTGLAREVVSTSVWADGRQGDDSEPEVESDGSSSDSNGEGSVS